MVKLYTIGCPACNVLERKLAAKNIEFDRVEDRDLFSSLGIETFPVLEVEGQRLDLGAANAWINNQ